MYFGMAIDLLNDVGLITVRIRAGQRARKDGDPISARVD
jgi:hypothetical protein